MRVSILIFAVLTSIISFNSCKKENNSPNNNQNSTLPDLNFSWSVTGDANRSESFQSPENNKELGGHEHGVNATHSTVSKGMNISCTGSDYSLNIIAGVEEVSTGTYTVTSASYVDQNGASFIEVQGGTLRLDTVSVNITQNSAIFYDVSGSFTAQINNVLTPPNTVTLTSNFNSLNVTSN